MTARRIVLGLVVGAVTLAVALWGVRPDELRGALAELEVGWLLPVAAVFMGQQALRATRQMLLVRALAPASTWRSNFAILCMTFFFINALPARLGEAVRPYLLVRREGLTLGQGVALVFVERLVDLTAVLIILAVVLVAVPLPAHTLALGDFDVDVTVVARGLATTLVLPLLALSLGLVLLGERMVALSRRLAEAVLARLPGAGGRLHGGLSRAAALALSLAGGFVEGLRAVRQPGRLAAVLALTAVTWSGTGFMYTMMARAFDVQHLIGWAQGMGVLVITMLGTMAPAPPGFAGVYEAACRGALALFGVNGPLAGKAVAFALVIHWWVVLVQALSAGWFFLVDGVSPRALWSDARRFEVQQR